MIAWLEKQGEQKRQMPLVKSVSKDFKDRLGTLMHYTSVDLEKEENKQLLNEAAKELLQLAYSDKANEIALASAKTWEESMAILMAANNAYRRGKKEQKPTEVEPKFKVKYAGSEYNVLEVKDIAGVTFYGIEDESNHIDYVKAESCEIISGYGIKENGSSYPTKPAMFSEQKSSWSEEDEKLFKLSLENLTELKDRFGEDYGRVGGCIDWLKRLKARVQPRSHWKPSENQMSMLRAIINEPNNIGSESCHLAMKTLYDDLLKLK